MWASDRLTCLSFDITTLMRLFFGLIQGMSSLSYVLFVILVCILPNTALPALEPLYGCGCLLRPRAIIQVLGCCIKMKEFISHPGPGSYCL